MNDLDELKTLLFGAEKEVLDSIQQRVQLPEARAADIAAVLPEAIRLRHREDDELIDSLRDPVGRSMRDAIHDSPDEFADVLYPVMGPAIRKSIAQAMRTFSEQINRTLEHSLTLKGLKWRVHAARAGVPFADYVIQRSLLYRIEQAYLISRENGLLINHVHHEASHIKDSDAVSAMFTAIQDFVKESFSPDRTGRLETADMGDFTLWAVHGPHALLVCVIRGVPPRSLRADLSRILEQIHFRLGDALRDYSGDTASVTGIEEDLQRCLQFEAAQPAMAEKKSINWPAIIIVLLLVAVMAYGAWLTWQNSLERDRLAAVLDDTPGLYVANMEKVNDHFVLHGLRDPLAASLPEIARQAGLQPEQLQGDLRPYRSLDESIVLQRIRQQLQPEDGVSVSLVEGGTVLISGTASQRWLTGTRQKVAATDFGLPIRMGEIAAAEWPGLLARASELNGTRFYFSENTNLSPASVQALTGFTDEAQALATAAENIGASLTVRITGHTDGIGSLEINERLANERANFIVGRLREAGIAAMPEAAAEQAAQLDTGNNAEMRSATAEVTLLPPGR
ncbi:MAG: hypothetical protein HKN35_11045 [Woeseia sp.]|nr:hypothetical protein [Woeseia sp.]MBT8097590.1 hypothetical protein [Woeseia sp.]NNE61423.1 hypothetical protein [Woeseia sp.]NNL53905.1 hypothetical protein [Woeseia sp.]